ncbi:hypothetical protein D7V80_14470 [Corallococcus sp. CA054B]|nr:hypothetical protein D7V80_14470 [Corallococcus sp. CA054B]
MLKTHLVEGLPTSRWEIHFLVLENDRRPVEEFLEQLEETEQAAFVARFTQMLSGPPFTQLSTFKTYSSIWQVATHDYRILGFRSGNTLVLTNGFKKTGKKTPPECVEKCQEYKTQYFDEKQAE